MVIIRLKWNSVIFARAFKSTLEDFVVAEDYQNAQGGTT